MGDVMLFVFSKKNKLVRVILMALIVAFFLIGLSFYIIIIKKGVSIKVPNKDLFETSKYYCEYDMNVFSNKNQNLYNVSEAYLNEEGNSYLRFDFNGENLNFSYIVAPNFIGIKSKDQINSLILKDYNNENLNLQSLSTFFFLKKHITDNVEKSEKCSLSETLQDDNLIYRISINSDCEEYKKLLGKNLGIKMFELVIDKNTNLPSEYIVYTNDEKVYLDINYKKFEINSNFDMKIFDF